MSDKFVWVVTLKGFGYGGENRNAEEVERKIMKNKLIRSLTSPNLRAKQNAATAGFVGVLRSQ